MDLGLNKIKSNKNRLTKQRLAILNYLKNTKSHPNAEKVYAALKTQIPNLSLATVYRNLKYLQKMCLIIDVGANQKKTRFDGDNSLHFHFICNECGVITDVFDQNMINSALLQSSFPSTNKINLNIYGLCHECQAKQSYANTTSANA